MRHLIILLCIAICNITVTTAKEVKGTVSCEGKGIEKVMVSDGYSTCMTDSKGKFSIETNPDSRFVYISTPSGYVSPSKDNVVQFYAFLSDETDIYNFELTRMDLDDTVHNIIVFADPQVFDTSEFPALRSRVDDMCEELTKMNNVYNFGICLGDLVGWDHKLYPEYNEIFGKTGIQIRNIIGNHDMTYFQRAHEYAQKDYEDMYGPSYYSFNVGDIHYIMLNDNFFIGNSWNYIGYLEERQLRWLEKDLSYIPEGSSVVLCLHIPSTLSPADREDFEYKDISEILSNKKALYEILSPYNTMILSGHMHTGKNQIIGENIMEQNIASLGGAWWCGDPCPDGSPAGYKIFNINGTDMQWSYKGCGYESDYQMKVYVNDPLYPGMVVANVWDYDEEWKVEYIEDGKSAAEMERFTGHDPYSAELYNNGGLKRDWVCALRSDNLFKATISPDAKSLEVRVTDRFGRTFIWNGDNTRP